MRNGKGEVADGRWRMANAATERAAHVSWVPEIGWPPTPMTSLGSLCLELLSGKGLESAFLEGIGAWFKSGLQLRGGWGRRPKGNAPRSEASALGARWLLPARSQPPNYRHLRGWQRGSSRPTPQ